MILSNQAGISLRPNPKSANSDMKRLADFKSKISAVLSQLDLPITVYAATGHDLFRKPRTGMWEQMLKDYGLTTETDVDLSECQFVGDAAGRAGDKAKGVPKDHSCSDRFASCSKRSRSGFADTSQGLCDQHRYQVSYA